MKHLKKLALAIALALVVASTGFAGETSAPPCPPPDPGETSAPPCTGPTVSGDANDLPLPGSQSALGDREIVVGEALIFALESMLTVF